MRKKLDNGEDEIEWERKKRGCGKEVGDGRIEKRGEIRRKLDEGNTQRE